MPAPFACKWLGPEIVYRIRSPKLRRYQVIDVIAYLISIDSIPGIPDTSTQSESYSRDFHIRAYIDLPSSHRLHDRKSVPNRANRNSHFAPTPEGITTSSKAARIPWSTF